MYQSFPSGYSHSHTLCTSPFRQATAIVTSNATFWRVTAFIVWPFEVMSYTLGMNVCSVPPPSPLPVVVELFEAWLCYGGLCSAASRTGFSRQLGLHWATSVHRSLLPKHPQLAARPALGHFSPSLTTSKETTATVLFPNFTC